MSTSVASLSSNFFPSAENGFTTTTSGSVSSGAATVGLNSVAGYTNGEVAVFVIDPTDPTKKQTFTGVVDTSGSQITNVVWTAGSNTTHALGATVVDYATATHISMISKGLLVEHNQDGTHATNMTVNTNNATLTSPKVITGVNDTNGNELLKVTATGSAVNELTLANAATGNNPVISATGDDTNIGITITPKGTGKVTIADSTNLGGAWPTWTPTLTNMTLGNGTVTAKYIQIGKTVFFRFAFVFGSTSAMGSIPRFSLPVTAASHAGSLGSILLGTANAYDNATNNFDCVAVLNSTTDAIIRVIQASGTNSLQANITSTNPMTWTTSDELHVIGQYEAA